jgi:glyoxylase-like metal-dependent hydrolase (beta-lactamase superfamily II)
LSLNYTIFNCGPIRPIYPKILAGTYCLLLETNQGGLLIDSGYGINDFKHPDWKTALFTNYIRTPRNPDLCVINQLQSVGIDPHSVKHIILTHMHLDHAGGVADFPWATVHVHQDEYQAAAQHRGRLGIGYLPKRWQSHTHWRFYNQPDTSWFGFDAITLPGFEPQVFLIPTPGHTQGHCMVAFGDGEKWVLQTGSAGFPFERNDKGNSIHPPRIFQRWVMGPYLAALKQLYVQHGSRITFLSGHEFVRRK